MKLVFVYWGFENAGSMLDLRGYTRAARAMGHHVSMGAGDCMASKENGRRGEPDGLVVSGVMSGRPRLTFGSAPREPLATRRTHPELARHARARH